MVSQTTTNEVTFQKLEDLQSFWPKASLPAAKPCKEKGIEIKQPYVFYIHPDCR
jgi:hypothetical protein